MIYFLLIAKFDSIFIWMIANTLKICPKKNIVSQSLKVSEYVIPLLPFEREVRSQWKND
jgi:hypothetical protein